MKKIAIYYLQGDKELFVPIAEGVKDAKIAYPTGTSVELSTSTDGICLTCPQTPCAVFLKIEVESL